MKRTAALLAALVLVGLGPVAPAVARARPDPAFKVPREEIVATVTTIGLMPAVVPTSVPAREVVAARLELQVVARLREAGFQVIEPQAIREIQGRGSAALGGIYDPLTGRAIKARADALAEFTTAEFTLGHRVDGLLSIEVVKRSVPFLRGTAYWDGVDDSSTGRGGVAKFVVATGASGRLSGLSLAVRLVDVGGKLLYARDGGLQLLEYFGRSHTVGGYQPRRVDPRSVMSDPARDVRALDVALDPLAPSAAAAERAKHGVTPSAVPDEAPMPPGVRELLLGQHRRVVLAGLAFPDAETHAGVPARYREELTRALTNIGFEVTAGRDYGGIWLEEQQRAGGLYDPITGGIDDQKAQAVRASVFATLRGGDEAVTAIVLPTVETRVAPFWSGSAAWDGVSELVTGTSLLGTIFSGSALYSGSLDALSLSVRIVDATGVVLYEGAGGIQLAERLADGRRARLVSSELYANQANDARAVEIALAGLAPSPSTKP